MSPHRKTPAERKATRRAQPRRTPYSNGRAMVNPARLVPNYNYSSDEPEFLKRGYYVDKSFACRDCGQAEIWTATQQKWWYESAKGGVHTQASRCRPCRYRERQRVAEARRVHLEGLAAKSKKSQ